MPEINTEPDSITVFALRKVGRLNEALAMARRLPQDGHDHEWNVRALGWVLADFASQALENGDRTAAEAFIAELKALRLAPSDHLLIRKREGLLRRVAPQAEIVSKAYAAGKAGDSAQAMRLFRQALQAQPDCAEAQKGLGWELYRVLAKLAQQDHAPLDQLRQILEEYADLETIEKPSLLHSLIMACVLRLERPLPELPAFARWWNVKYLRPEDWQAGKGENGKEYTPLALRLMKKLYQVVKGGGNKEELPWVTEFLKEGMARFPEDEWLPYFHGKLLVAQGHLDEARKFVLPIIRAKRREFWVWDVLASTCGEDEFDLRKACLCKALQCGAQNEGFLCNVILEMAWLMKAEGNLPAAKCEIRRYSDIRQVKNWPTDSEVERTWGEQWYQETEPTPDNDAYYEEFAPLAEAFAFEGVPWMEAVVSGRMAERPGVKACAYILVGGTGGPRELRVNAKGFPCLREVAIGAPVHVRVIHTEGREMVVDVRPREGTAWDILPERLGVVSHINTDKGVAAIAIGVDLVTLAYFDHVPGAKSLLAGDVLQVRCQSMPDKPALRLVTMRHVEELPRSDFVKDFAGEYEPLENGMVGFVGDVFIPPALSLEVKDGAVLVGLAIRETNRKNGRKGWKAICARENK